MKTFLRHKTYEEIKAQCKEQGLRFGDVLYLNHGYDTVSIKRAEGALDQVVYNTVNGRFFGNTDYGLRFSSDYVEHDGEPWFQALLDFFYVEKPCD